MSSTMNLRSILDANKLTNANFLDWVRNLRIVLKAERIIYVLDGPLLESTVVDASDEDHNSYQKHLDDNVCETLRKSNFLKQGQNRNFGKNSKFF